MWVSFLLLYLQWFTIPPIIRKPANAPKRSAVRTHAVRIIPPASAVSATQDFTATANTACQTVRPGRVCWEKATHSVTTNVLNVWTLGKPPSKNADFPDKNFIWNTLRFGSTCSYFPSDSHHWAASRTLKPPLLLTAAFACRAAANCL